jgi:hypothetical protein
VCGLLQLFKKFGFKYYLLRLDLSKHQFGLGTTVYKYSSAKVVLPAPFGPAMVQQVGISTPPFVLFPGSIAHRYKQACLSSSFRQGSPEPLDRNSESRHRDVKLWADTSAQSSTCAAAKLPSMALDSGIHAGMTVPLSLGGTPASRH